MPSDRGYCRSMRGAIVFVVGVIVALAGLLFALAFESYASPTAMISPLLP